MLSPAQNDPFIDGNKRVAFAVTYTFFVINGARFLADADETYAFSQASTKPTGSILSISYDGFASLLPSPRAAGECRWYKSYQVPAAPRAAAKLGSTAGRSYRPVVSKCSMAASLIDNINAGAAYAKQKAFSDWVWRAYEGNAPAAFGWCGFDNVPSGECSNRAAGGSIKILATGGESALPNCKRAC